MDLVEILIWIVILEMVFDRLWGSKKKKKERGKKRTEARETVRETKSHNEEEGEDITEPTDFTDGSKCEPKAISMPTRHQESPQPRIPDRMLGAAFMFLCILSMFCLPEETQGSWDYPKYRPRAIALVYGSVPMLGVFFMMFFEEVLFRAMLGTVICCWLVSLSILTRNTLCAFAALFFFAFDQDEFSPLFEGIRAIKRRLNKCRRDELVVGSVAVTVLAGVAVFMIIYHVRLDELRAEDVRQMVNYYGVRGNGVPGINGTNGVVFDFNIPRGADGCNGTDGVKAGQ